MLTRSHRTIRERSRTALVIYAAFVVVAFVLSLGEGYLGPASLSSLLLTLPWSVSMLLFGWAVAHDGTRSVLIFLVPFAVVNAALLYSGVWRGRSEKGYRGAA